MSSSQMKSSKAGEGLYTGLKQKQQNSGPPGQRRRKNIPVLDLHCIHVTDHPAIVALHRLLQQMYNRRDTVLNDTESLTEIRLGVDCEAPTAITTRVERRRRKNDDTRCHNAEQMDDRESILRYHILLAHLAEYFLFLLSGSIFFLFFSSLLLLLLFSSSLFLLFF